MIPQTEIAAQLDKDKQTNSEIPLTLVFNKTISPDSACELLENKPNCYWLIRESTKNGMISITYKLNNEIRHKRYVFSNGEWSQVLKGQIDGYLAGRESFEPQTQTTIKSVMAPLLNLIFQFHPFSMESLLRPTTPQASINAAYIENKAPYTVGKTRDGKTEPIYTDPVTPLKGILDSMKNETKLEFSDAIVLPLTKQQLQAQLILSKPFRVGEYLAELRAVKKLFVDWLELNKKLVPELSCPVTADLFEEPYYLVETGQVYDYAGIFCEDVLLKKCPLTGKEIKAHPVHLPEYRRTLEQCLIRFFDIIASYQNDIANQGGGQLVGAAQRLFPPSKAEKDADTHAFIKAGNYNE